jgi:hypothetical protein
MPNERIIAEAQATLAISSLKPKGLRKIFPAGR